MTRYALLDKSRKTRLTTEAPNLKAARKNFLTLRSDRPFPEGWAVVSREEKPAKPEALLKVGCLVLGQRPCGRWAEGTLTRVDRLDEVWTYEIDDYLWTSRATTKLVKPAPTKKSAPSKEEAPERLEPGHFRMKMDSGDTLEFWLEEAPRCLYLRSKCEGETKYIAGIRPTGVLIRPTDASLPGLKTNEMGEVML